MGSDFSLQRLSYKLTKNDFKNAMLKNQNMFLKTITFKVIMELRFQLK